jgi:hypothetical protein
LGENIKKDLTSYAKPLFIRLEAEVEHTGLWTTFFQLNLLFFNIFFYKNHRFVQGAEKSTDRRGLWH